jgi:predicted nucleic acid-binding protein
MKNILLDTDVILDFFFDRQPFSAQAAAILSLCERRMITAYVTPVIISNVYYLLRKTAERQKAIERITLLISIMEVLTMDKNTITKALASNFNDFEDALQNYAAEAYPPIEVIVTRNVKDYKHSALSVVTPEHFLQLY